MIICFQKLTKKTSWVCGLRTDCSFVENKSVFVKISRWTKDGGQLIWLGNSNGWIFKRRISPCGSSILVSFHNVCSIFSPSLEVAAQRGDLVGVGMLHLNTGESSCILLLYYMIVTIARKQRNSPIAIVYGLWGPRLFDNQSKFIMHVSLPKFTWCRKGRVGTQWYVKVCSN